jgi:hypothetical protein
MTATIQKQVRLPLSVAMEVVLQGIRIRLGRSLVTLMGVVLGIAFLMAILTGQSVRRGVSAETETRTELKRMLSFLQAETGPLRDRTLGVLQVGRLSPIEVRFVELLRSEGARQFNWVAPLAGGGAPPALPSGLVLAATPADAGRGASAVVVLGDGSVPAADWSAMLAEARQKVVAVTRKTHRIPVAAGMVVLPLERELRPDELEEKEADARRNRFRTGWIIVISLLVTVIGISNAMLMSVTERFREIGTMKCLGALSSFVRKMFFIESSLLGLAGALAGTLFGVLFATLAFSVTYGGELVMSALDPVTLLKYSLFSVVSGVLLSVVAAIYPANFASRMLPAVALRSTI